MKFAVLLALAAIGQVSAEQEEPKQIHEQEEPKKKHPVSKVVTLLEDMKTELEKEAESDEELYDKMACWCETNDKAKTKAIEDAEARITDLQSKIEKYAGASARLKVEIPALEKEIAQNQKSLEVATAQREKQAAEFTAEEKDMLQCVKALKDAITVLSKHHGGAAASASLLAPQPPVSFELELPSSFKEAANIMKHQLRKHGDMIRETLSLEQRKILGAMLQEPALLTVAQQPDANGDYFDAAPTGSQSYAPQSGQIFGILKQLKEDFESNLSAAQKEEIANQETYAALKEAKEAEIAALEETLATKKQELADADEKLAQSKEDLEDTNNSLNADQKFLMELKLKCQSVDVEWEERQKTRKEEIEAVNKAIEILTTDEARELFSKTFNPTFAQKNSRIEGSRRDRAAKVLIATGQRFKNPAMVEMATALRLNSFTRVKKAIDDMVAELLKEKKDEIEHRDMCIKDLNTNELTTESTERDKSDTETTIEDLTGTIEALKAEIATLEAEIKELNAQLAKAAEDRDAENAEFQATVADQRATQKLVGEALAALKAFYDKKAAALLARARAHQHGEKKKAGPPPPPGFDSYEKNRASGGVMAMLQQIITDAGLLEKEAIKDEENAQTAYQEFQAETNNSIDEKTTGITNKSENLGKAEAKLVEMKESLDQLNTELEGLSEEKGNLKKECDFILKNFTERQAARDQEIDALRQVKAILSGMKPPESL